MTRVRRCGCEVAALLVRVHYPGAFPTGASRRDGREPSQVDASSPSVNAEERAPFTVGPRVDVGRTTSLSERFIVSATSLRQKPVEEVQPAALSR